MQRIKYLITTLSPILFSKESGDRNMTETLDFIPGRVLLGIFAGKFIKDKKLGNKAHEDEMFGNLFLKDKVSFSNAYIKHKKNESCFPTPFSIQYEKENKDNIYDLLIEPVDAQTKYADGYCLLEEDRINIIKVEKSLNFHHGRDMETGTSKNGIIFNYESINKDQIFEGYISGNPELLKSIYSNEEVVTYTGRSKSSQYGKIKIKFSSEPLEIEQKSESGFHNTITLLSDLLLFDDLGKSDCSKELFEKYLQEKISNNITIIKSFIRPKRIDNFVSIWNLKRPSEICFAAGSCFLIEGIKETDLEKLKELEIKGIGERQGEGFGKFAFRNQRSEKLINDISDPVKIRLPEIEIPETTKKYIQNAVKEIIVREIKTKAITDARTFYNDNKGKVSKSLIGRLESFIKGSISIEDFVKKVIIVRKTAKDKLVGCKMGNDNFYDFMLNKRLNETDAVNAKHLNSLTEDLIKEIYDPSEDSEMNNNLYKIYYLTFFAFLRKLIKKSDVTKNMEEKNG